MASAPKAPDPAATANAQAQYNKGAAISQQNLNMVNQQTPYGSLNYSQTGTASDGTPTYTATTTLAPAQQQLLDTLTGTQNKLGAAASGVVDNWTNANAGGSSYKPIDTSTTANYLYDLASERLNPALDRRRASTETQLLNRGIVPGTEAYTRAMEAVTQGENDAQNQLYLTGQQQAYGQLANDRSTQYQMDYLGPLQALSTFLTGSAPTNPTFQSTPQAGVNAPDYTSAVQQNYQQQVANNSSMLGGIGGLAGTVLGLGTGGGTTIGGTLLSGLGGLAFSDERLKEDIERVGETDAGTPIYTYRYVDGGPRVMGVMAQDLLKTQPEAVHATPSGFWAVDYARVA